MHATTPSWTWPVFKTRNDGMMEDWNNGIMEGWNNGIVEDWNAGNPNSAAFHLVPFSSPHPQYFRVDRRLP
jgi:hypothetical protein